MNLRNFGSPFSKFIHLYIEHRTLHFVGLLTNNPDLNTEQLTMLLNKSLAKYLLEKCCHLKFHLLTFRHLRLNCRFQLLFSQIMTPYNNQVFSCLRVFTMLQLTRDRACGPGRGRRPTEGAYQGWSYEDGPRRRTEQRPAPRRPALCRGNTARWLWLLGETD